MLLDLCPKIFEVVSEALVVGMQTFIAEIAGIVRHEVYSVNDRYVGKISRYALDMLGDV